MLHDQVTVDVMRQIGAALADVTASAGKLGSALKIKGQIMACEAIHKSAEPGSLMVRVGISGATRCSRRIRRRSI